MNSRAFYNVSYRAKDSNGGVTSCEDSIDSQDFLDNDTELNANQFKLYDNFTTDLRIVNLSRLAGVGDRRHRAADPDDSGVDMENGNAVEDTVACSDGDLLENEVMLDPWSSMESSNSPLTDSGPSASEDCTPSTSSEPTHGQRDTASPSARCIVHDVPASGVKASGPMENRNIETKVADKARARNLTLDLETVDCDPNPPIQSRRPHFLDEDYHSPSRSNFECRIPKPHFLDHTPSPDELDEKSDMTNPNFLDDDAVDGDDQNAHKKCGALPKRPNKNQASVSNHDEKPHKTNYRSSLHYGLENAARSTERDKKASQLYRGTWPGDREIWTGHDTASVRSFSSNGSDAPRPSSNLENKMECVYSLLSLLTLSPDNNADLSGPLLDMSRSYESCMAMRQAGCIPLLVQLIHSKLQRETRDRAAKALRNIIRAQTVDKAGRREARVWRLLEQVREYCYFLEDIVESRKEGKQLMEDDTSKHPIQCVAALMKLSFDEEHRHVVCQLGGLQALAALVSGDQAAHGSKADDGTCLTMRRYAGMTLTNLTFGDGNNKSLLCSFKDFMLALVEQLESPNEDMRQVTAAVLRNLSWRADTNSKQVLREVGAVKGLTKAAMTCHKEATLKSVLSALWNLTAHCSMNKVALCSVDGALGFLVDMLSYDSPTKTVAIIENAGGIVRNVSSHIAVREDYRLILRERNCLSVLLQHLKSPSLTVVSNSCGTLWNLSARCPLDQQFLWDHSAVPMLRSLIHSKHQMIAKGSSAALKNLLNSKPGKSHIISLDSTARNMNLPALPTLGVRKQKALEQEIDQNLSETWDNIEPATSPTTSNRDEKNLFTATERQIAMNVDRNRMTASSPLMGNLTSQVSLSHSANLASYLSCSNSLLKGTLTSRSATGSSNNVNRSDSKDSVTSTRSDSVLEKVARPGKVPIPTPRSKDLVKNDPVAEVFNVVSKAKDSSFNRYPSEPPIPPPRNTADLRTSYTESGYDVDHDSCDQPIDYSRKYSEAKSVEVLSEPPLKADKSNGRTPADRPKKYSKKDGSGNFGDYQETDLDQPTDYSLRYAELQSETGSDISEPPAPSVHEDTIKHFCTEGTPYETPIIFSTATSMSDLRTIGTKDPKGKNVPHVKDNPEVMTHSDEKDTCSIEEPPRHDNDRAVSAAEVTPSPGTATEKRGTVFDTKFSSGMISPEKPVNYCDEGTPGYFSRVSSLSSLGEPTEEDNLAKKNAMATINAEMSPTDENTSGSVREKEGSKAVTFASEPIAEYSQSCSPNPPTYVEDTPLMFSRTSSLGSLPECEQQDDHGSVISEVSRMPSGCLSPSDIPDSPAHSVPGSPRACPDTAPTTPPQEEMGTVFEERTSLFVVEDTPAHFSTATSLSELTIPDDTKPMNQLDLECADNIDTSSLADQYQGTEERLSSHSVERQLTGSVVKHDSAKESSTPNEACKVYFTEDTPFLSKAGSNSDLSALSIDSGPNTTRPVFHDTSDSSNLSDAGDLLEQCIQKGIDQVVKNKGQSSESANSYLSRDTFYRSLPPYLRSSTETVKLSHDSSASKNLHDSSSSGSPPPPLPPKSITAVAPPRPPLPAQDQGRRHESRLPVKTHRNVVDKPKLPATTNLARQDSLSSLSLDSFGSTDREIFEETVKAGVSSVNPRATFTLDAKDKSHSVERPSEPTTRPFTRQHKSLDRSDKISQHKPKVRDFDFERMPPIGAHNVKSHVKGKKQHNDSPLTRSPYSYHGDTPSQSLVHHAKWNTRGHSRFHDDGPPSLPARIDAIPRLLERSNSLSSLSNDSFGSTDKEVFERCVRVGMSKANTKSKDSRPEEKLRVRSDDRLEVRESHRSRRRQPRPQPGALDRMMGEEYSKDRAILEEVIAKGAGEKPPPNVQSKNVPAPSVDRASADGSAAHAPHITPLRSGCDDEDVPDLHDSALDTSYESHGLNITQKSNQCGVTIELPVVDSGNTTFESIDNDMDRSNEFLAPRSVNTTLESEIKDELNRSNESYAEVLDESWSDFESTPKKPDLSGSATLTRSKNNNAKLEWTDIKLNNENLFDSEDVSYKKSSTDTWNDYTCPDDVTFPTISGSIHLLASMTSEMTDGNSALPDLLEKSDTATMSIGPDLTNRLNRHLIELAPNVSFNVELVQGMDRLLIDSIPEPSFASLLEDSEPKVDSISSSAIEMEAARLAAQLRSSLYAMGNSTTSLASLELDSVKPPSNLGSTLSLTASGQWEESSNVSPKKSNQKSRKKSLPVALMVKRALSNSMHQSSSEHLNSDPVSFLDNVKPPSEMDHIDMESSIVSVSSIVSESDPVRVKTPVVFDLNQPVQDFPLCNNFITVYHDLDLDNVNPPSLFHEIAESTAEYDPTTAQQVYDDCISNTLNVVTDIPSGSETCTPIMSDVSSVDSTPTRNRYSNYLTPKEKRIVAKDRYQTYTIADSVSENDALLEVDSEEFLTWTKYESDSRSDDYVTATSEPKLKRKVSAKQRRQEDRARYQTQTVDISNILKHEPSGNDPQIENLKQRLASKRSFKQKRIEEVERFRTRTLSDDIAPSPTFIVKDPNFEHLETTTGYDSLSSNEQNQHIVDDNGRIDYILNRDVDSGHNDDDFELNSTQVQTYSRSFRNDHLVTKSPAAIDLCIVKNLKNIEITASYRRSLEEGRHVQNPSTSDFASFEGDSDPEDACYNVRSAFEVPIVRPKPKIIKPEERRDESLDSNESLELEHSPKAIRGRKKALYVSPYRRNIPTAKKPTLTSATVKSNFPNSQLVAKSSKTISKPQVATRTPLTTATYQPGMKPSSATTSPKKTLLNKGSPSKIARQPLSAPTPAVKRLPIERQGTFTKEDSTVPANDLPVPERKVIPTRIAKTVSPSKSNTSPSRLPQPNSRLSKSPIKKLLNNDKPQVNKTNRASSSITNSASNHSLHSNDSGRTIMLASKSASRQGSTTSVNSVVATKTKEVESKIANLWRKVEQSKKQSVKADKRVWIEGDKPADKPRLIRSSTFEGPPVPNQVNVAPKQKSAIAMKVSQIPNFKAKAVQSKPSNQAAGVSKRPATGRLFLRKLNGQSS